MLKIKLFFVRLRKKKRRNDFSFPNFATNLHELSQNTPKRRLKWDIKLLKCVFWYWDTYAVIHTHIHSRILLHTHTHTHSQKYILALIPFNTVKHTHTRDTYTVTWIHDTFAHMHTLIPTHTFLHTYTHSHKCIFTHSHSSSFTLLHKYIQLHKHLLTWPSKLTLVRSLLLSLPHSISRRVETPCLQWAVKKVKWDTGKPSCWST